MFCEIDMPFLLAFIIKIIVWIGIVVFVGRISATVGGITGLLVVITYISCTIGEFSEGHIIHGIMGAIPIISLTVLIIIAYIKEAKEEEIRKAEIPLIPDRVEKYISMHGFTSPQDFIKYSNENPEFQNARMVKYTNPLYTKQVEENKKRAQNKQKPLEITEPSRISYGKFASFKYKEIVLTYFMKELREVIKNIYMFDYADIYAYMPSYSDFFANNLLPDAHPIKTQPAYHDYFEDISSQKVADLPDLKTETDVYDQLIQKYERINKVYFQQACSGVIRQLIIDGMIERVASGNLFKSMIIPESEGNIVEGKTIEISI